MQNETAEKQKNQTEQIDQLKKEFSFTLSRLSHEIRNPISLISSELQLMASSHPKLCSCRQWDSLMDNLEYVRELLHELSDFSHAGTVPPFSTDPQEFLNTVFACEKTTLDYLGIALETHIETISAPVFLDRIKMRQVIFNLIRNSCEAIDHPGGKITVNLFPAEPGICISIQDNGCGMTDEQLQNIFRPFVTYKSEGTGLGLAVTSEIIAAHHGQLKVSSVPGQGSVFYIYLNARSELQTV